MLRKSACKQESTVSTFPHSFFSPYSPYFVHNVRLQDHGPLAEVSKTTAPHPVLILYNYEPDQLSHHSVHGSHVLFVNEGLVDFDRELSRGSKDGIQTSGNGSGNIIPNDGSSDHSLFLFRVITVCYAGVVFTLESIRNQIQSGKVYYFTKDLKGERTRKVITGVNRVLTHEETGHLKSYERDRAVRKWCKRNGIPIMEYNQTGVTRCLSSRDDYSKLFRRFADRPLWPTPDALRLASVRSRLAQGLILRNRCHEPLRPESIREIPAQHRVDRLERQSGWETEGQRVLASFLESRAKGYSAGISSPNTSWTSGGRISPYLTWGHLSTKSVVHALKR